VKNKVLLAYAIDFVSFLIERSDISYINRIILFGSVSRSEASEESDIDLFIDVIRNNKHIKNEIEVIKEKFLKSTRYENYWLLKDIKNEIKPIIGKLSDWKELKNSILSNGLVLYGKFEEIPAKVTHKTIFSWENIKPESKRVLLSKRLFGYKKGKKNYEGILQRYNGERMGKGMIIIETASANIFLKLFRGMSVTVKIKKIIEYS